VAEKYSEGRARNGQKRGEGRDHPLPYHPISGSAIAEYQQ